MHKFLIHWAGSALTLVVVAFIVPGVHVSIIGAVLAALVLGLVNAVIRPVLILITLPLTIATLGLFLLVINAVIFWFGAFLVPGFSLHGIRAIFVGAVLFAVLNTILHMIFRLGDLAAKATKPVR